jgi:hypothetical protein
MEQSAALREIYGDHFPSGLAKNIFPQFKQAGIKGSGIDTIVLLEERMDLRIQVEATLRHLFNRKISLEWDSGNLVARAALGAGDTITSHLHKHGRAFFGIMPDRSRQLISSLCAL